MTVQETLTEGKRLLTAHCTGALIDTPQLDAALLLAETLHKNREELIMCGNEQVSKTDREKFLALLERRRSGECIAYILGRREFRGLNFAVNPNVLVPRPDTETLFEAALDCVDSLAGQQDVPPRALDLCTGSGALAIALKKERPFLSLTASDISKEALDTAVYNAERLLTVNDIHFVQSDLFDSITEKFSLIVSNPPYVPSGEISFLAPEVRREPSLALDGGADGLELIRKIILRAPDHLLPGCVLLLEASQEQMPEIKALLGENNFNNIEVHKDLAGRDRVISARFNNIDQNESQK